MQNYKIMGNLLLMHVVFFLFVYVLTVILFYVIISLVWNGIKWNGWLLGPLFRSAFVCVFSLKMIFNWILHFAWEFPTFFHHTLSSATQRIRAMREKPKMTAPKLKMNQKCVWVDIIAWPVFNFQVNQKKKCLFRVEIWMKCSNFRTTSYDNHEAIWMKSQLWQATNSFKIKHWHNPLSLFMTLKLNWQSQYWSGRKNWINFVEIDEIDVWPVSGCDIIVVYTNCSYALWYFPMNFARALIEIPKRIVIFARISTFSPVWMHFARTNSDPQMVFTLLPSVRLLVAVKCTHSQQQWT